MSEDPTPIAPLVVEFTVAAPPDAAFALWTERAERWWPTGHTVSGGPVAIMFEPRTGGRIIERAPDGTEHVWGEVVAWEPPHRVRYRWHLFFAADEATVVDLTFTASGDGTLVRLEQTGWEALGDQGPIRRERTVQGWAAVTGPYRDHLDHHPPGGDP